VLTTQTIEQVAPAVKEVCMDIGVGITNTIRRVVKAEATSTRANTTAGIMTDTGALDSMDTSNNNNSSSMHLLGKDMAAKATRETHMVSKVDGANEFD
jgi:hypothetical protein